MQVCTRSLGNRAERQKGNQVFKIRQKGKSNMQGIVQMLREWRKKCVSLGRQAKKMTQRK